MKRRAAGGLEGDILGIEGVGAFVDTAGSKKRKRRVVSEGSDGGSLAHNPEAVRDTLKDEVEERLEEILFGKQKLGFSKPCAQDTDSESEEEVCMVSTQSPNDIHPNDIMVMFYYRVKMRIQPGKNQLHVVPQD